MPGQRERLSSISFRPSAVFKLSRHFLMVQFREGSALLFQNYEVSSPSLCKLLHLFTINIRVHLDNRYNDELAYFAGVLICCNLTLSQVT